MKIKRNWRGFIMFTLFWLVPAGFGSVIARRIVDGEVLNYQVSIEGKVFRESMEFQHPIGSALSAQLYKSIGDYTSEEIYAPGGKHQWDVETDRNGKPKKIAFEAGENHVSFEFTPEGNVKMQGDWNGKVIQAAKQFKNEVTAENILYLRTRDFSRKKKYVFSLLQLRELPDLKAYPMYFQLVGKETVTVKAGTFKCLKVRFSLTGLKGFMYKAYFYISDDDNRTIVKINNVPKGGSMELVEIFKR